MLNPSTIVPSYHSSTSPSHRFAGGARVPLLQRTRLDSPPLSSTPTFRVHLRAPFLSSPIVSSVSLPRRPSSPGPPFPGISTPFSPGGVVPPPRSLSVSVSGGDVSFGLVGTVGRCFVRGLGFPSVASDGKGDKEG